ncbi:zeta toxin family protein [Proteus mirabilis]|nr:zeta toxin family protein [Proteus mirabilis]ELB1171918.1 zeta toxin family protein [Proteus mirabilis]MBI6505937.1 zeta toxin family protein [Proteus mirabilis]
MNNENSPVLWVFAGINGAGKSTIQQNILENTNVKVINADSLASQKPLMSSGDLNTFGGGREAIKQVRQALKNKESFSIESTLGGNSNRDTYALRLMQEAQKKGYQVKLMYVALDSVEIAKERIKERVKKGGHNIDDSIIERRYPETLSRLSRAIELSDEAYVFDNTNKYKLLAQKENGKVFYFDPPKWITKYLPENYKNKHLDAPTNEIDTVNNDEQKESSKLDVVNGFMFDNGGMQDSRLDLDALAQGVKTHFDGEKTHYYFENELAFFDYGQSIRMANGNASENDAMVLLALQTASTHHKGGFKVVGDDAFIEKSLRLIAEYDLKVILTDKKQNKELEAIKEKLKLINHAKSDVNENNSKRVKETTGAYSTKPSENNLNGFNEKLKENTNNSGKEKAIKDQSTVKQRTNKGFRGELVKKGSAPFDFKEGEKVTPYIVIKSTDNNEAKTIWGVDFPRALAENNAKIGDIVNVKNLGKKDVEVDVPIKDDKGNIKSFKKIKTIRNTWEITPEYPKATNTNPDSTPPKDFKAYDYKSFIEVQNKVYDALYSIYEKNDSVPSLNSNFSNYKSDYIWFYPNGKIVPDSESKPLTLPKIPENNRLTGNMIFAQEGTKGASLTDGILFCGKDGYFQGVIRDEKTDVFHDVIAKVNLVEKDGMKKSYISLAKFKENQFEYFGYGNLNEDGSILNYKNNEDNQLKSMKLLNYDIRHQDGFIDLFNNHNKELKQSEINKQTQEATHVYKQKLSKPRP